jgi:hypothetical protein
MSEASGCQLQLVEGLAIGARRTFLALSTAALCTYTKAIVVAWFDVLPRLLDLPVPKAAEPCPRSPPPAGPPARGIQAPTAPPKWRPYTLIEQRVEGVQYCRRCVTHKPSHELPVKDANSPGTHPRLNTTSSSLQGRYFKDELDCPRHCPSRASNP